MSPRPLEASNSDSVLRILIVDDDPVILKSLPAYFLAENPKNSVETATNGSEALRLLETRAFDAVLSDVHMPEMNGFGLLFHVVKLESPPAFVAMTAFDTNDTMLKLLELGAAGYFLKSQPREEVVEAVYRAINEGVSLSPECVNRLIAATVRKRRFPGFGPPPDTTDFDALDRKIIVLISEGMTNREIAKNLCYSESTIRNRISRLMRACGARSRSQLLELMNF